MTQGTGEEESMSQNHSNKSPTPPVTGPIAGLIAVMLTLGLLSYIIGALLVDKEIDVQVAFGLMGMILFCLGAGTSASRFWPGGGNSGGSP